MYQARPVMSFLYYPILNDQKTILGLNLKVGPEDVCLGCTQEQNKAFNELCKILAKVAVDKYLKENS